MAALKYRPEIDGLRAVAVMAVVMYHAGFAGFSGGFVGVDVFFVISGYLITGLIVREVRESDTFDFGNFYLRRIRRLFPALLSTVVVTWVLAFVLLSPAQMKDFGASAIAAVTSLSNFYFWFEADYFDAAALTKPLLHTWSLSVEEQFYLVWPALLVFGFAKLRSSFALIGLMIVCVASLLLAEHWLVVDREAAFYLLPARVVELGIGAALVWLPTTAVRSRTISEVAAFAGLAMIAWAVVTYDHDTVFPGLTALLPCIGTALFIAFSHARMASAPLRFAPMVWIGQISYSLYLVHWPIIVFYASVMQQEPTTVGKWLIMLLSLMLGWLQFHFVETRFRKPKEAAPEDGKRGNLRFAGMAAACAVLVSLPSAGAYLSDGLEWRIPEHRRQAMSDQEWRRKVRLEYCSSPAPAGTFAGDNPDLVTCQNHRGKRHDILVWGDSHGLHLASGLAETYKNYNVHVIYMNGCLPQSGFEGYVRDFGSTATQDCVDRNRRVLERLSISEPAHIIITSAKRSGPKRIAKATGAIVERLGKTEHRTIFLADFIRPGRSLIDCISVPDYAFSDEDVAKRCAANKRVMASEQRFNERLAKLMPNMVRVTDLQCASGACTFFHRGKLLYRDSHHLNIDGSVHFVRKLRSRLGISTKNWAERMRRHRDRIEDLRSAQTQLRTAPVRVKATR